MTARRGWPEEVRKPASCCGATRAATPAASPGSIARSSPDGMPGPAPSTVRRWAAQEDWKSWAGEDGAAPPQPEPAPVDDMWRRQVVRQVEAALRTPSTPFFRGAFDGDRAAAEASLTEAAASMEHLLAQPGVRALLRAAFREEDAPPVFFANRERQAWERLVQRSMRR